VLEPARKVASAKDLEPAEQTPGEKAEPAEQTPGEEMEPDEEAEPEEQALVELAPALTTARPHPMVPGARRVAMVEAASNAESDGWRSAARERHVKVRPAPRRVNEWRIDP
jgi:hypothetical protein